MPELRRCVGQMGEYWMPVSEADRDALRNATRVTVTSDKPRTTTQNKSMWLYCEKLARALNEAGYDMRTFPWREGLEIPFSKNSVMESFWRPTMDAIAAKESTTDQSTKDVMAVYEAVSRAMAMRVGISVAWPCRETQEWEAIGRAA